MADLPGVHIVEIRAGTSQRPVLELRPGQPVQPMSIGRVGMWTIDAPDLLDVHAYLYFDGRALFVQSADPANPAKGNGQAIGSTWQQIEIPCTIELGRARLVYRTLDDMDESDDDKTVAQAIQIPPAPAQYRPGAGAFSNRNSGPDSDQTRLQPMNLGGPREPDPTIVSPLELAPPPVPKARPAAGMPAWSTDGGLPNSSPTAIGGPPAPPPPQQTGYQAFGSVQVAVPAPPPAPNMGMNMGSTLQQPMQSPLPQQQPMMQQQPYPGMPGGMPGQQSGPMMINQPMPVETGRIPTPPDNPLKRAVAEWKAMPPIRKVILGSFPGVALLVYFMLFDDPQPVPVQPRRPAASASASASALASASATATATGTSTTPIIIVTAPTGTTTAPTTSASAVATTPTLPKGQRTLERQAIDFVAAGQYTKAIEVYDQLAVQHPDQPVFKEAARLLRQRTN